MQTYTITRTGDAPLKFSGELVASADGKHFAGRERNRWYHLAIYESDGRYIVAIEYLTQWQGEATHHTATVCRDAGEVRAALRDYDPASVVAGFPPGEQYADRQRRLLAELQTQYDALVSDVLSGDEFAATADDAWGDCRQQRDLARYRMLLDDALRRINLTRNEACAIMDALNGWGTFSLAGCDDHEATMWPGSVADSIRLDATDEEWEIDGESLMEKIRRFDRAQLVAVADAAETFWNHCDRDTDELLRELGLIAWQTENKSP